MWDAFAAGDYIKSREIHYELIPLHDAMFLETNPIPVKTALGLMEKSTLRCAFPCLRSQRPTWTSLRKCWQTTGCCDIPFQEKETGRGCRLTRKRRLPCKDEYFTK